MDEPGGLRWDEAGPLTSIDADLFGALDGLPHDPVGLCRVAQGLLMLPDLAPAFGLPDHRQDERSIQSASAVLRRALELDPSPLGREREPVHRVIGTCRHFALLSTALLRHRSIPARARCGFAGYFVAGKHVDHWITEHRDSTGRWVRVDAEILDLEVVDHPDDLAPGEFLTGGEAWRLIRDQGADPMDFGVDGVPHAWGIAEVRGNAIRDLAALNKVETLPWDEWGEMTRSYEGRTGAAFDERVEEVAAACASSDPMVIEATYAAEDLVVPPELLG